MFPGAYMSLCLCRDSFPTNMGSTAPEYTGEEVYAVVFDAGSTGSRVHVLKFEKSASGLQLLEDTFDALKPGLGDSGWMDEPERAAASLQPLLEKAISAVPEEQQGRTPVELRATAGLRLLGEKKSKLILEAVTKLLENSPFMLVSEGVSVMDGIDEGAFAWLTLNYLLGKTGKPAKELVGAIDLGGGSVQQAFAVDDAIAKAAPEGVCTTLYVSLYRLPLASYSAEARKIIHCILVAYYMTVVLSLCTASCSGYIRTMAGGGVTYNVYVWSYLGYGLMQGRGAVLGTSGSGSCINSGATGSFKGLDDKLIPLESAPTGGNEQECKKAVVDAMHVQKECHALAKLCTFDGAWGAVESHEGRPFYVSSYFFDKCVPLCLLAHCCHLAYIWVRCIVHGHAEFEVLYHPGEWA